MPGRTAASPSSTTPGERSPASAGALPNLLIIGAQKCGTTALHYYLRPHPEISMSRVKELNFFIEELNWKRGSAWYSGHFDARAAVRGESSPDYTAHPYYAGVPERMHSLVPDARLIFMVRDPIERVRAQWIHHYANRVEHKPLEQAVAVPGTTYIPRSSYAMQLERFLEHYPLERVLVIDQDELLNDRRETLRRVFRFLQVDEDFRHRRHESLALETRGRRRRTPLGAVAARRLPLRAWRKIRDHPPFSFPFDRPELTGAVRAQLAERLGEDVARFRELTGRRFENWSI